MDVIIVVSLFCLLLIAAGIYDILKPKPQSTSRFGPLTAKEVRIAGWIIFLMGFFLLLRTIQVGLGFE